MTTKKVVTKEETLEKENAREAIPYFYAVGKRKTAIAQVRIIPVEKSQKEFLINDKKMKVYFPIARLEELIKSPFSAVGFDGKFEVSAKVMGGGVNAQAEAIRLGIARALIKFDETLRKSLKDRGLLTRDSRTVERKKPGKKKARRSPQWAKR